MAVTGKKVLRFTADADTYDSGLKSLEIAGVRLVAPADSVAKVYVDSIAGEVLYSLSALAKTADDSACPTHAEGGKLYISMTGVGAEVFVYLK